MATERSEREPESPSEREARLVMTEHLNLTVEKIPTGSERRADYRVDGDTRGYLVEVKSRNLPAQLAELQPEDGSMSLVRSMRADVKVGDYLQDAKEQMQTLDPSHERLWFVWISTESNLDADAQAERIFSALYGFRTALEVIPPHREFGCYYARQATFDRFPEIDGVVVYRASGNEALVKACVNEASPRAKDASEARFCKAFKPNVPSLTARDGEICIPRGLFTSEGELAVLNHIQTATGIQYLTLVPKQAIGEC